MKSRIGIIFLVALAGCTAPPVHPSRPPASPETCTPERLRIGPLELTAQNCQLPTGHWRLAPEPALPGLALWHNDTRLATVLQLFAKPVREPVDAVLPALRAQGLIPPDEECIFSPVALRAAARSVSFFQIKPVGARLRALHATPPDQVPEPPCGTFGASTHGVRYFVTDLLHPGWALYLDEGQDGTFFDPQSLVWVGQ